MGQLVDPYDRSPMQPGFPPAPPAPTVSEERLKIRTTALDRAISSSGGELNSTELMHRAKIFEAYLNGTDEEKTDE